MAIGGYLGSIFGGPLGAILGAVLGHKIEGAAFGKSGGYASMSSGNRSMIFCASAAAMLAKLAKADGHVLATEITAVEQAFQRLGFSPSARRYAIEVFRRAKDDTHTIYEYAYEFASAVPSVEVRELFYELLWELAKADGVVSRNELAILRRIPRALGIRDEWFEVFAAACRDSASSSRQSRQPPPRDPLADAYAELAVSPSATDDEVKKAYREKAKKYHPDALKAQGLPDEMLGKATERMARINAAWDAIKEARGL